MRELELLIEDYERRLKTVNVEKEVYKGKMKYSRLEAKACCYRYFLVELRRVKSSDHDFCIMRQCSDSEGATDCGYTYSPKIGAKYCPYCGLRRKGL